jgi:hypothetical protein
MEPELEQVQELTQDQEPTPQPPEIEDDGFVHFFCPHCKADISKVCTVVHITTPVGKDRIGRVMMAQQSSVSHPMFCPLCDKGLLPKPSVVQQAMSGAFGL